MHVYHYYAIKQISSVESVHYDGIFTRDKPFSGDWEEYQQAKRNILGNENVEGLVIRSLSLIST